MRKIPLLSKLALPALRVSPPLPQAVTADTPEKAVDRLRDLSHAANGWLVRLRARQAELQEIVPDKLEDMLEMSEEKLSEAAKLQVQIAMAEAAVKKIQDDERALIHVASRHIDSLRDEVQPMIEKRLRAVEEAARDRVRNVVPQDIVDRVISMLPEVRSERAYAQHAKTTIHGGIAMVIGPDGEPVPNVAVTGSRVIRKVDSILKIQAEVINRSKQPIRFAV